MTAHTFTYAPVAVGVVLLGSGGWSASGPRVQGDEAKSEAIDELERVW
ncbi:MAG: hypothetical protein ACRDVW_01310 [Acidimicrobiales bacterium]